MTEKLGESSNSALRLRLLQAVAADSLLIHLVSAFLRGTLCFVARLLSQPTDDLSATNRVITAECIKRDILASLIPFPSA